MKLKKYRYNMAFACFNCKKSFKREVDLIAGCPSSLVCPHCGGTAVNLGRHFKPPKKRDNKQWQKVEYLFENGFHFQKIYSVPYPKTLEQAKDFVKQYKDHAWHLDVQI